MTSNDDNYRAAVYTNALIMKEVVQYLDKQTLARLSQAGRQGWQYALQPLWRILPFISVGQIERFGTAAGNTIMIKTRGYATYGDLVHTVGLSLLSGRWEKVKPEHLKIIVENCKRLKDLDINLCLAIGPEWIAQIFQASPTTSASLTSLNLTEVAVNDIWLIDILKATPNLKSLEIGETDVTNRSLQYIGESMKALEYIEMRDCLGNR
ncbi:hypothetical protein DL89DRAFT_319979 [Linderina pennispora]|uniref:RNI-like protein n=1 Tax=Linderina pennispora TaxID=61395 RepID=A0A1Y1WLJ8_9FUNG|nr:uncharacterized protein DL89DRAFT_319979 [Linderina pennispora]ORX74450.1 hypothetical protein DL89DRAFT_319979 [Linderina pennispora]